MSSHLCHPWLSRHHRRGILKCSGWSRRVNKLQTTNLPVKEPSLTWVPFTPNHFLLGQMRSRFARDSVDTEAFHLRKIWSRVQELVRHFWHRWFHEWIPSPSAQKKWRREQVDLKAGDIPRYSKRRMAFRKDCKGVGRKRQQSAGC